MQDGKTPLDMAENEEVKALLREHGGKLSLFGERVQVCNCQNPCLGLNIYRRQVN